MTVAKLKGARDRAMREHGKCEGRKSYAKRDGGRELIALARALHRGPPTVSAARLAERGYMTPSDPMTRQERVAAGLTSLCR